MLETARTRQAAAQVMTRDNVFQIMFTTHTQWLNALRVLICEALVVLFGGASGHRARQTHTLRDAASLAAKHTPSLVAKGLLSFSPALAHDESIRGRMHAASCERLVYLFQGRGDALVRLADELRRHLIARGMGTITVEASSHLAGVPMVLDTHSIAVVCKDNVTAFGVTWTCMSHQRVLMVDDNLTPSYWLFNVKSQLFAFSISLIFFFYFSVSLLCFTLFNHSVLLYYKVVPATPLVVYLLSLFHGLRHSSCVHSVRGCELLGRAVPIPP
jgi:hypothetical protein